MIQTFHDWINPLNIYALAVVLVCCAGFAAALAIKARWPETETVGFSVRFVVAALFFKIGYSTYESLDLSGSISPKYLNLDAVVLLILFSFVMGSTMTVLDLRARVRRLKRAHRETAQLLVEAKDELESIYDPRR